MLSLYILQTSIPQIDGSNIVEDDEVLWKWAVHYLGLI